MSLATGNHRAGSLRSAYADKTDEELLADYRGGDAAAFEELVHRHERHLYGYLRRYLADGAAAEDAFQATFLQVHLKREQFDVGRSFQAWLYAIATNQAIDAQRRMRRRPIAAEQHAGRSSSNWDDEQEQIGLLLESLESREPEAADVAERAERARWVARAIADLPDPLRGALILIYYQGLKYREAAEALCVPVGTVKSRLHAALRKLNDAWNRAEQLRR